MNETTSLLVQTWTRLASIQCTNKSTIRSCWEELERAYAEPKRHYHNLQHIEALILLARQHGEELQDLETLCFAIFYHDAIYQVDRKDNEERSAELAARRLKELGLPQEEIDCCVGQIIATKTHEPNQDPDTAYLLDFDLSILGQSWERYAAYSEQIRAEYAKYPDFLYRPGRKKVLQQFLAMDRIFKTDAFFESHEKRARENLERELNAL